MWRGKEVQSRPKHWKENVWGYGTQGSTGEEEERCKKRKQIRGYMNQATHGGEGYWWWKLKSENGDQVL